MKKTIQDIGEFGLIDQLKAAVTKNDSPRKRVPKKKGIVPSGACPLKDVAVGIGDDTAVIDLSKTKKQLLTADMLVEQTHFTKNAKPQEIGWKALCASISDIASMGGVPKHALVSLGIPKRLELDFVKKIYAGLQKAAAEYGVAVVGGDTVKSDKIVINVALTGEVEKKYLKLRSGAKPGDVIFVSGKLGGSLKSGRHLTFTPRLREARFLVENYNVHAMMDISDGLAADLSHICRASGVGAILDEFLIPLNRGCTVKQGLYDGEDFELLFTLSERAAHKLIDSDGLYHFYPVGIIDESPDIFQLVDRNNRENHLSPAGFRHF